MDSEDLIEVERAGRRCGVCRSGRKWRQFEVVRRPDSAPVVVCGSCASRYPDVAPVAASAPVVAAAAPSPRSRTQPHASKRKREPPADRLRAALSELPKSFSTGMAARAAGLNNDKALTRLSELEDAGEIRRVGNRWSTESPPSDLALAMDRLQAQTSNLRIVRERPGRLVKG